MKIYVAVLGTLAWLGSLQGVEYARQHGWVNVFSSLSGYILGFVTAFAGYLFWEIVQGRGSRILGEKRILKWISGIVLIPIFLVGFAGFVKGIWWTNNWIYGISAFIGVTVVTKCLIPFLEVLQGE